VRACGACGTTAGEGQQFCIECGQPIVEKVAPVDDGVIRIGPPRAGTGLLGSSPFESSRFEAPQVMAPSPSRGPSPSPPQVSVPMPPPVSPPPIWSPAPLSLSAASTGSSSVANAVRVLAVLGGTCALIGVFTDYLGDNATLGFGTDTTLVHDGWSFIERGIVAVVFLVAGCLASHRRRGAIGLAAGSGAALASIQLYTGMLIYKSIKANSEFGSFAPDVKWGPGFWLMTIGAGCGVLACVIGLADLATADRRPVHPVLAMLGAAAVVAFVGGFFVPPSDFGASISFHDWNFSQPGWEIRTRMVLFGVIALGGVIGFLSRRMWGVGFAVGSMAYLAPAWIVAKAQKSQGYQALISIAPFTAGPLIGVGLALAIAFVIAAVVSANTVNVAGGQSTFPPPDGGY
jgi:hypothetical protein